MRTIKKEALNRSKVTASDLTPAIGVSDNHLLVKSEPHRTGPFASDVGVLPSIQAKSFRVTNHGSSDLLVSQRIISFYRYFDSTSFGLEKDSPSILVEGVEDVTPIGKSQVLQLTHTDDTSVFTSVPAINAPNLTFRLYFKILEITDMLQPLGVYSERSSIDINHPAASVRVKPDLTIAIGVGLEEKIPVGDKVQLGKWYRATINTVGQTEFNVSVDLYELGAYTSVVAQTVNYTSSGPAKLDEVLSSESFVIGFSSEGVGKQQIEAFEVFRDNGYMEKLLPQQTKEYFCTSNLDEYSVDGPVTGYYRS